MRESPSPARGHVIATFVAAAAGVVLFREIHGYALVGWDTLPEIAASRVTSLASLLAAFTEQTAQGYFPYGAFYRPLFNLSLALDYAVWGLDPVGYLLTGCVLYAATALATYRLILHLLGRDALLAALLGLATFLLMPLQIEVVPIVSRRADMLCSLAIVLAVSAQVARANRPMPGGALLPAVLTAIAVAAKEPGLVAVPLGGLVVLLATDARGRARLGRAAAAGAMHAVAAGLVTVGRVLAIGGMGGLPMARPSGAVSRLPDMLGRMVLELTVPGAAAGAPPALLWGITLLVLAAALAVIGALVSAASDRLPAPARRVLVAVALALVWLVASAGIFGVAGLLQPWYLFVPGPALAVLVAAATQGAALARDAPRAAWRIASRGTLVLALIWLVWQARYSPLVHHYAHWQRASELTRRYFATLHGPIAAAAPGAVVRTPLPLAQIPADPDQPIVRHAMVMRPYSVQAWADLVFGDGRVTVRTARTPADAVPDTALIVVLLDPRLALPRDPPG